MTAQYIESWIDRSPKESPVVAAIKRPDGRVMTSAMLGAISSPSRPLATLANVYDVALAALFKDGAVTISFPNNPKE